MLYIFRFNTC